MKPDSETRFVGVRTENGIKTVRTYGFAGNARGKVEQVYSVVQNQRTISQEFTGRVYRSVREAENDSWKLNSAAVYEV